MRNALHIKCDSTVSNIDLDSVPSTYQLLNESVGGMLEMVSFRGFNMYVNEEGKIHGLPWNRNATILTDIEFGIGADNIVGDVVLVGPTDSEGEDTAFPEGIEAIIRHLFETNYQP